MNGADSMMLIKESTVNQCVVNLEQVRRFVPTACLTRTTVEWIDGSVEELLITFDCVLRHLVEMKKSNHGVKT